MRLVIQRVSKATVSVDKKMVGKIGKGLFILVGVGQDDKENDAVSLAEKVAKLRIMGDQNGKLNLNVLDTNSEILAVSQFTLFANTNKGNRPSFIKAADPDLAKTLYRMFVAKLIELGIKTKTGRFGAYMEISSDIDGPVTILLDSKKK